MAITPYRYLFYDLLTNAALAELPMKRVRFDQKLNEVGSFVGYLELSDPQVQKLFPWRNTPGGRTVLYVDRGGRIVWGGIVVTRKYSQGPTAPGGVGPFMMQIGAQEFMWYFKDKRTIAAGASFTNVDQLTIAQSLFNTAQGVASGNIGVAVPTNTSGVLRSRTWLASERKKVGEAVIDLSRLDNGFDWQIRVDYGIGGQAAGIPGKQLALGYPRLGEPFSSTGWMWEFPGNIVDYSWAEDSSLQAVTAYVQGSGTSTSMVQSSNTITSLLDGGYPLLEEVFRAKDETDASSVAARAVAYAKAYSQPVTLPQVLVRADLEPVLGAYSIGDDANIRITSPQYPVQPGTVGYDVFWRIIGIRVEPQDDSKPERVYLTLGAIPT